MKRVFLALAILLSLLGGSQAWAVTPTYRNSSDFHLPGHSPLALENMGFKTYKLRAGYMVQAGYSTAPTLRPFELRAGDIIGYKDISDGAAPSTISADGKWRYVELFYVAYMPCENRIYGKIWISRDFEVRVKTVIKEVPAKCPTCPAPPPCQPPVPAPPPPCQTCALPPTGAELPDQPVPAPRIRVLFNGAVNQAQVHREFRPGIAQDVAALTYAIRYRPTRVTLNNTNSQSQEANANQAQTQAATATQTQNQAQNQKQKQGQAQQQDQKGGNVTTGPVSVTTTNTNNNIATNPTNVVVGDNNSSDMQTDTTATNGTDPPVSDSQNTPPASQ